MAAVKNNNLAFHSASVIMDGVLCDQHVCRFGKDKDQESGSMVRAMVSLFN